MKNLLGWLVLICMIGQFDHLLAGEADKERFLRDYPSAGKQLEAHYTQIHGLVSIERTLPSSTRTAGRAKAEIRVQEGIFAIDRGFRKFETSVTSGRPEMRADRVQCIGPNYGFRLIRANSADPYEVDSLGGPDKEKVYFDSDFGRAIALPYSVYGAALHRVMTAPEFRLLDAESFNENGRQLMRVDYEISARPMGLHASVVLDPNLGWCIRKGDVRYGDVRNGDVRNGDVRPAFDGIGVSFSTYYEADSDGRPIPSTIEIHELGGGLSRFRFRNISFSPTPESEFTMPHYGLPDIAGQNGQAWYHSPYFGLSIILVLAAVLSFLLSRVGKRASLPA